MAFERSVRAVEEPEKARTKTAKSGEPATAGNGRDYDDVAPLKGA